MVEIKCDVCNQVIEKDSDKGRYDVQISKVTQDGYNREYQRDLCKGCYLRLLIWLKIKKL